ncbi:DNA cytosine methyltransferase [Chryseobacterium sp. LC2016-29]|uniref:DNA cytosine methyltransferase n=1 Tax=Chryseobacterium sp. LC2016-29 TaxID=2897331 RepID=UPI001E3809C7|nr:DNA cytosine methyltransferase [Chryseobacterium sp. LC2016-29]MCD0480446.1 DNA cytosine methyltransferase [Chryseobacterium sp. LC2016-29]
MKKNIVFLGSIAISLLYIDLFCGAGGTSTGVESAKVNGEKCAKVIVCVNHDPNAIASHAENHPDSMHLTEDIRTAEMEPIIMHVNKMRKLYPFAKVVLWASLECTNHSKAKGGMSRDADSRTLAEHLDRYIIALNPDSVQIENVEEFMVWGNLEPKVITKNGTSYCPLDINKKFIYKLIPIMDKSKENIDNETFDFTPKIVTKNGLSYCRLKKIKLETVPDISPVWVPDPAHKGVLYKEWISKIQNYGYNYEFKILNAADFGAYTSRKRLFIQFNKSSIPIVWPEPTHAKNPKPELFQELQKWKAVKEVLDLDDEGISIFGRKIDLVEATLDRVYHGLIKFVAGGKEQWLLKYNSKSKSGKHIPPSIENPAPTVPCQGRLGLLSTSFLTKYYSGNAEFMNVSLEDPSATLRCKDSQALIQPKFLMAYYGNGYVTSIENSCPTTRTKDTFAALSTTFIDQQFGNSLPSSIETVLGGLTANPKYNPVTVNHWIMDTSFNNTGSSLEDPARTMTANRKWHYLMDAQYSRVGNDIENPCFTLIARMDKTPPYLVEIDNHKDSELPDFIKIVDNVIIYEIYSSDSPMLIKIKEFMAHYGLKDIKMRMLKIQELKEIMGFPKDYILIGTQADQKKFIGNAVEVTIARKICEASAHRILKNKNAA